MGLPRYVKTFKNFFILLESDVLVWFLSRLLVIWEMSNAGCTKGSESKCGKMLFLQICMKMQKYRQINYISNRIEIQKLINTSYTKGAESKYGKKKNLIIYAQFGEHAWYLRGSDFLDIIRKKNCENITNQFCYYLWMFRIISNAWNKIC